MTAIHHYHNNIVIQVQWNLRVKDTLGLAILSPCREAVFFLEVEMYCIYTFGDIWKCPL